MVVPRIRWFPRESAFRAVPVTSLSGHRARPAWTGRRASALSQITLPNFTIDLIRNLGVKLVWCTAHVAEGGGYRGSVGCTSVRLCVVRFPWCGIRNDCVRRCQGIRRKRLSRSRRHRAYDEWYIWHEPDLPMILFVTYPQSAFTGFGYTTIESSRLRAYYAGAVHSQSSHLHSLICNLIFIFNPRMEE